MWGQERPTERAVLVAVVVAEAWGGVGTVPGVLGSSEEAGMGAGGK